MSTNPDQDPNKAFNRDRFGEPMERSHEYIGKRSMGNMDPADGEMLSSYIRRLNNAIYEQSNINLNAHVYGRKTWYTHKNALGCWMCNDLNLMEKCSEMMMIIQGNLEGTWAFSVKDGHSPNIKDITLHKIE